jgi:phage terminase large subunit-like protein
MRSWPKAKRILWLSKVSDKVKAALLAAWEFIARPHQRFPLGAWVVWLILAGRGWGKTRTGAEAIKYVVENGIAKRIALVGATAADVRDVMIEGESGILSLYPDGGGPVYEPSKRRLTWPCGAVATAYSAEEPQRLRGPQHDFAWCDELAAWKYQDTWDMLMFGLRLGDNPRVIVTTTPKPIKRIRELLSNPKTLLTRGSTFDNKDNLAPSFFEQIVAKYEGTTLGQQELYAQILDDMPGALWKRDNINKHRVMQCPELLHAVVGVDPAAESKSESNSTGIIVGGMGYDYEYYVLGDYTVHGSPDEWANASMRAARLHNVDCVVPEKNQGGEMVTKVLRTVDKRIPILPVHASKGKRTRAEPIAALYEQGKVHHVGSFPDLEDELCSWVPDSGMPSPDRLDALVWALTAVTSRGSMRGSGTAVKTRRPEYKL